MYWIGSSGLGSLLSIAMSVQATFSPRTPHTASAPLLSPPLAHSSGQHEIMRLYVHTPSTLRESLRCPYMNMRHTFTYCVTAGDASSKTLCC